MFFYVYLKLRLTRRHFVGSLRMENNVKFAEEQRGSFSRVREHDSTQGIFFGYSNFFWTTTPFVGGQIEPHSMIPSLRLYWERLLWLLVKSVAGCDPLRFSFSPKWLVASTRTHAPHDRHRKRPQDAARTMDAVSPFSVDSIPRSRLSRAECNSKSKSHCLLYSSKLCSPESREKQFACRPIMRNLLTLASPILGNTLKGLSVSCSAICFTFLNLLLMLSLLLLCGMK